MIQPVEQITEGRVLRKRKAKIVEVSKTSTVAVPKKKRGRRPKKQSKSAPTSSKVPTASRGSTNVNKKNVAKKNVAKKNVAKKARKAKEEVPITATASPARHDLTREDDGPQQNVMRPNVTGEFYTMVDALLQAAYILDAIQVNE